MLLPGDIEEIQAFVVLDLAYVTQSTEIPSMITKVCVVIVVARDHFIVKHGLVYVCRQRIASYFSLRAGVTCLFP